MGGKYWKEEPTERAVKKLYKGASGSSRRTVSRKEGRRTSWYATITATQVKEAD